MTDAKEKYGFGDYSVTELSHYTIPLNDGVSLSCRVWVPDRRDPHTGSFSQLFSCFNSNTTDVTILERGQISSHEKKNDDEESFQLVNKPDGDSNTDTIKFTTNDSSDELSEADDSVLMGEKFPVILEYLPYYKDILTASRDYARHPWFTSHGYVVMRVEMRGTGGSEGSYFGEYLPMELRDCSQVLQFITQQIWSNGKVGMYGKSWGGFNGLQMGYLEPDSSPLKTAISLYSTDNRYTDDIHYEGGCPIGSGLLSWSGWMFAMNALPPPPRLFPTKLEWFNVWRRRLERGSKSFMSSWLQHQLPGPMWQQGSIDQDYNQVTMPVLVFGGLEDGYTTSAERMARKLNPQSKFIIGPWVHNWPDVSVTGPRVEFLELCRSWFDHHLKGTNEECTEWPRMQVFVRNSFKPEDLVSTDAGTLAGLGRFVAFPDWIERGEKVQETCQRLRDEDQDSKRGSSECKDLVKVLYLVSDGENKISRSPPPKDAHCDPILLTNHPLQGAKGGMWLRIDWGFPEDQTTAISHSASFHSEPLQEALVMVGVSEFVVKLTASSWRRVYVSVKVSDVHPDGFASLITRCQYDLNYLKPLRCEGDSKTFSLSLRFTAHCFQPGHRVCISASPNNFPLLWPSLIPSTLYLHPHGCKLVFQSDSPENLQENEVRFPPPRPLLSVPYRTTTPSSHSHLVTHIGDRVRYVFQEDSGLEHLPHTFNLKHFELNHESYECDSDVTTAVAKIHQEHVVVFDSLQFSDTCEKEIGVKIRTHQVLSGDADSYSLEEKLVVSWNECGEEVFSKRWQDTISRQDHNTW